VSALRSSQLFEKKYGVPPVDCNSVVHRTLGAMDVVSRDPQFCLTFPNCVHQQCYLKVISTELGG